MNRDNLGDRMKSYENITRTYLPSRMPVADVMPVRHGYWQDGGCYEICSVCGADHDRYDDGGYLQDFAYCPACGAKMDAEEPTNE